MIVVDASAVVELLLRTRRAAAIAARLVAARSSLHAPDLVDLEVASAIRGLEARGSVSTADATAATQDLLSMPLVRYPHDPLIPRIWRLRGNLTSYDGAYVALAEHLGCPLITCDAHLAGAPGNRASVELFA